MGKNVGARKYKTSRPEEMKSFLLISLLFSTSAFAKAENFFISEFKGHPKIVHLQERADVSKISEPSKNKTIRGQVTLRTDDKSEMTIHVDPAIRLKIYPDSEVFFPNIIWESGKAESFTLKKGQIRWEAEASSPIKLESDLFEASLPAGVFLISYNPKTPQIQVLCFKGEFNFQEKDGESSLQLKAGKKAHFLGKIEDGEIAYDILLHGRKIPKGQKSQIEDISPEEIKKYSREEELKLEKKQKAKAAEAAKKSLRKDEICKSPGGIFNECAWICEANPKEQKKCRLDLPKVKCIRKRCNANGIWSEPLELDKPTAEKICQATPVVQACDY